MSTINITLDTNTLKAVAKKALIALGVVTLGTAGLATASVAQSVLEVRNNYDIVDLEIDGQWIGNFDCEAGTYRAPFGNNFGLNPFVRYEMGEELGEKLIKEKGVETAIAGSLGVAMTAIQACASRPVPPVVPAAPVVAAPAPVAPAPAPVVAAPEVQGEYKTCQFKDITMGCVRTWVSNDTFTLTWDDGVTDTYTRAGGPTLFQDKLGGVWKAAPGGYDMVGGTVLTHTENGNQIFIF